MTQEEKNKGSKDRPDLGRGPDNMVKVEIFEDKPKYPPYVLVEDALGHDIYHSPADHQPTEQKRKAMVPETTTLYGPQIRTKDNQVEGTSGHQVGGPRYVRAVDRVGSLADKEDWEALVPAAEEFQYR